MRWAEGGTIGDAWLRWLHEVQKDLKLWLCLLGLLASLRALLVAAFWDQVGEDAGAADVAAAMLNGLRFDLRSSVVLLLPCFVTSLLCAPFRREDVAARVRHAWGTFVLVLTALVGAVDVAFVAEYGDQFNHWIFGLVFDDVSAIATTVWKEQPVVPVLLGLGLFAWLCRLALRRWLASPILAEGRLGRLKTTGRIAVGALLVVALVGAGRGSFGSRPVRLRDAAITGDPFLNKLVLDPYSALRYAIEAQQELSGSEGLKVHLKDGDVEAAAARLFPGAGGAGDLVDRLERRARGALDERPSHIVLVVAEGYDTWPMLPAYESLGLTPRLQDLAERGISIDAFVSAGGSTESALVTLIAGLPHAGLHVNYRPSAREPYPTSLPKILEELGYTTRFFYGGYLSWQRIGEFARDQGFDEVYGGSHMGSWSQGNEWGVDDEVLLRFALERIDPERPSFDLIMTTSYHSPFDIDVHAHGFPLDRMPEDLVDRWDGRVSVEAFGHLWYADRQIGEFVAAAERRLPRPLFAVTGDHGSRRFLNRRPGYFEKIAVPCVLYGPGLLDGLEVPARTAGSHLDLVATLIELAAPAGHVYPAFGRDMLAGGEPLGLGRGSVVAPDYVVDLGEGTVHPVPGAPRPDEVDVARLGRIYGDLAGLGWWLVVRGRELPDPPSELADGPSELPDEP